MKQRLARSSGDLSSFELPRGETPMMQMIVDSRWRISRGPLRWRTAFSKFQLELHLAIRHLMPTYRTHHPCTSIAECAVRLRRRQFPTRDRFAGFAPKDSLVRHASSLIVRPRTARGMADRRTSSGALSKWNLSRAFIERDQDCWIKRVSDAITRP